MHATMNKIKGIAQLCGGPFQYIVTLRFPLRPKNLFKWRNPLSLRTKLQSMSFIVLYQIFFSVTSSYLLLLKIELEIPFSSILLWSCYMYFQFMKVGKINFFCISKFNNTNFILYRSSCILRECVTFWRTVGK